MKASIIAGLSLLGAAMAADVPSIEIKGKKFFYSNNGTEFFIRGVAYQPNFTGRNGADSTDTYTDPLAIDTCKRDIPYLVQLRTNVVRTYAVDPSKDHDECMTALADAGIYLITDLSSPSESIQSDDPTWNSDLFTRYSQVVDAFAKYPNVIGFFAGNEVSNKVNNTNSMAYVKAAVRDMKSYIKQKNYRSSLGVGYATDDDATVREDITNYLVCDEAADSIDFFGYNIYEWCGDSSYQKSGYADRTKEFADYPVPAFFSEYGCNEVRPRKFTDVPVLFGDQMTDVWSGGIVYMYYEEANKYGLVTVSGDDVSTLSDFSYLSKQMASATPTGVNSDKYSVSTTVGRSCPTIGSDWNAASKLPPSPNADLCECMYNSLECVPNSDITDKQIGTTFGYLGGESGVMDGVQSNSTSGTYGAYSMCSPKQQLAWAMNVYYQKNKAKAGSDACGFNGVASTKKSTSASGSCATQMSSAGSAGTGAVSAGLAASTAAGASGSGSSGSSTSGATSSGIAAGTVPHAVHIGAWQAGAYAVAAVASGIFMVML
ncbi:CAZyme family GH72 and CBM43 [Penicillium roqueforti]|uniref:1,3-beta-glucanosyltransferase n=1 Tax=Penicillium roqueforti (strain FM164) TaxID=1365484 RepID=W6QIM7_PENRF|nr:CAZyme family GH72 and CBM43 [Penicillium roqueforti]CDM36245.1 Glucanosyltransferase [Penicillium roqueforti FM164]KAF9237800.1 CAZyme family GH72 and CBM43 [Penicillium roqueforti]KAI1829312.1 CAZyme family GH72 and CBM43 [Penicillium roqueforti]KAI2676104.1 CAZyme family GH72 and CBM43 [Penicillium roqueforti]KAI2684182.1 CAZyme family GH72 and CBM43 [Penicillium roqueforti]